VRIEKKKKKKKKSAPSRENKCSTQPETGTRRRGPARPCFMHIPRCAHGWQTTLSRPKGENRSICEYLEFTATYAGPRVPGLVLYFRHGGNEKSPPDCGEKKNRPPEPGRAVERRGSAKLCFAHIPRCAHKQQSILRLIAVQFPHRLDPARPPP
jgi:hypothetical protein